MFIKFYYKNKILINEVNVIKTDILNLITKPNLNYNINYFKNRKNLSRFGLTS